MKATVAERTRRQQTRGQSVPGHGVPRQAVPRQAVPRQAVPRQAHPAGMAHQATRLRLVADRGRLLPREQAVPRREPARRVAARPGRIPDNPVPERTPIRLTRRGRVVVAMAVVLLVSAVSLALVLWVPMG